MSHEVRSITPLGSDDGRARARFLDDPGTWLPSARPAGAPDVWRIFVHGAGMDRPVTCTVGGPWSDGELVWRRLTWIPVATEDPQVTARWLPTLEADIGLATEADRIHLVLMGSYEVPLALLGEALDATLLRRVARGTINRFGEQVARQLTSPDEVERTVPVQTTRVP